MLALTIIALYECYMFERHAICLKGVLWHYSDSYGMRYVTSAQSFLQPCLTALVEMNMAGHCV